MCQIKYKTTDSRTQFCAGEKGKNKDTCQARDQFILAPFNFTNYFSTKHYDWKNNNQGDSGGPLIVRHVSEDGGTFLPLDIFNRNMPSERWYLAG